MQDIAATGELRGLPVKPLDLLAALQLESGKMWGEIAAPFQWEDAEAIFADDGPRWHFLTRPRGGSKTTDLAGVALCWLATTAPPGARGYVVASDRDQAALLTDAAAGLVSRTPELSSVVDVTAFKISNTSGATVEVLAADGSSAFGLRPSLIVADEVANWPETRNARRVWSAIVSSLGKVKGSKFVCITSAGEPSHSSYKVLQDAKKSPRWRVHEVAGPLPWIDESDLRAQGLRDSEFARFHLNAWQQSEDRLVSVEDLEAAAILDGEQEPRGGVRYLISCDLGLVNDKTVVAVGHSELVSSEPGAARRVVIDSVRRWRGKHQRPVQIGEVEAYLSLTSQRYNRAKVLADPWQAAGMIQRLKSQGVSCAPFPFTSSSTGRIGQALHLALRNRLLWLPNDPDLLAELARVRLRETGIGQARLDHDSGDHDDQAVAIAIIVAELIGNAKTSGGREWLESLAPLCAQCNTPNLKGSTACHKCGAPIAQVEEAAPYEPETPLYPQPQSQRWSPWSPISDRPANGQTAAALQVVEEFHRSKSPFGHFR